MSKAFYNFIFIVIICLFLANCANRGRPSGGDKDVTPPMITKSEPENFSTNFTGREIKITFDEFIKIKNIQKHLIISPPMDPAPEIMPLGSASKTITIKITDTLDANTTYAFNFGNSIVDNNESNPYPYYRYVFSTGDYIDSLSVKGHIIDATLLKPDEYVSVMLYEMDSTYTDSTVYKKKPKYITNTLDSTTTFSIDNIKAGNYMLIALKDENQDSKYQQRSDKIGFLKNPITVPTDSLYTFLWSLLFQSAMLGAYLQSIGSLTTVAVGLMSITGRKLLFQLMVMKSGLALMTMTIQWMKWMLTTLRME